MWEKHDYSSFWVWLISLNMMISSGIHFPEMTWFHSSLWMNNTPLCVFFSVDVHLGWFHNLSIVNSAMINMGVQVSLLYTDLHSLRYIPRSGITELYGSSIFRFCRTSILISEVNGLIYIPTCSVKGSIFSSVLPAFFVLCFIDDSHSDWDEMQTQCSFDLVKEVQCFFYIYWLLYS
jgi:hypothetical protein